MIPQLDLSAELRDRAGKAVSGRLRRSGHVPVVLYGGKEANRNLQVIERELVPVLKAADSTNVLVNLKIKEGAGETAKLSIVKSRQFHPVTNGVVHVDFFQVALSDSIDVRVPIETTGIPAGIKEGGVVVYNMRALRVRGKVQDIPDKLSIEISALTIGQSRHVSDLTIPAGIKVMAGPTEAIVSVSIPTELAEPTPGEAAAATTEVAQPEVIGEKERLERQAAKAGGAKPEPGKAEAGKKEEAPKAAAGAKPAAGAKEAPKPPAKK